MERPGVVAGNFAPSFSLNFLSIFVHIWGSIGPITLIWASLERSFPPALVHYRWCHFWSKVMTSEEEERPRFVTTGYGRHRRQWVKGTKRSLSQKTKAGRRTFAGKSHRRPAQIQRGGNVECISSLNSSLHCDLEAITCHKSSVVLSVYPRKQKATWNSWEVSN